MATVEEIIHAQNQWVFIAENSDNEIVAHARKSLQTCKIAIQMLGTRLEKIGYPSTKVIQPCSVGLYKRIERLEQGTKNKVPQILKLFWEIVGGVSLVDYDNYSHDDFWSSKAIGGNWGFTDALSIDPCVDEWVDFSVNTFQNLSLKDEVFADWNLIEEDFYFELSPDGNHKDNISGSTSYGMRNDSHWLPMWHFFSWSGYKHPATAPKRSPDFMQYLRTTILECGGFPGLFGHERFEPYRLELIDGLPVF